MLSFNMPRIKFTFDVNEAINNYQYKDYNFSNITFAEYDENLLIKQDKLIYRLNNDVPGICVLISIYNAFPMIFNEDAEELYSFLLKIMHGRYYDLDYVIRNINRYYNKKLLCSYQSLEESYKLFVNNVTQYKRPVVITYQFTPYSGLKFAGHAISLYGYDDNYIYYFENSEDDYLFRSLAKYIKEYYRFHDYTGNDENILKYINCDDEYELWQLAYIILGHEKYGKLSTIKKCFVTDGTYFYDSNGMATYNDIMKNYNMSTILSTNRVNYTLSK